MTLRPIKCFQFRKRTLDFSLECIKLLPNDFLNNDIYHLMQPFLVKIEFTRTPTCAELFLLGIYYIICQRAIKMLMGSMICAFVVHIGYKTCFRMMGPIEKSLLPEKEA